MHLSERAYRLVAWKRFFPGSPLKTSKSVHQMFVSLCKGVSTTGEYILIDSLCIEIMQSHAGDPYVNLILGHFFIWMKLLAVNQEEKTTESHTFASQRLAAR